MVRFSTAALVKRIKRMVASVEIKPELRHSDDLTDCETSPHLPVVNCKDCGATMDINNNQSGK